MFSSSPLAKSSFPFLPSSTPGPVELPGDLQRQDKLQPVPASFCETSLVSEPAFSLVCDTLIFPLSFLSPYSISS